MDQEDQQLPPLRHLDRLRARMVSTHRVPRPPAMSTVRRDQGGNSLMKLPIACALLVCQSFVLYGLLLTCQKKYIYPTKQSLGTSVPLSDYPVRVFPNGSIGIGTSMPDNPVVFKSNDATELYRLRADGTEWYAPGVDRVWVQGVLFQIRCPKQARCL